MKINLKISVILCLIIFTLTSMSLSNLRENNLLITTESLLQDESNTNLKFTYNPPGTLIPKSGEGVVESIDYSPKMRFPIEKSPAFCNSQVYNFGGFKGPKSQNGWKDKRNYQYPWFDNFCEKRSRYSCCPGKKGHQGQDIRPATSEDKKHFAVACDDGQITQIGSYSVRLRSTDGRNEYRYLHLDKETLKIKPGDKVKKGDVLGFVSNEFNGVPTTVHLHFEIRSTIQNGNNPPRLSVVSPYSSLVNSYEKLLNQESLETSISINQ